MIKKNEVQYIAKLARLSLTEKEIGDYQKEFSKILSYFEKLKKPDIAGIKISSCFFRLENATRKDRPAKKDKTRSKNLIDLAAETEKGYLKIKSILSNDPS